MLMYRDSRRKGENQQHLVRELSDDFLDRIEMLEFIFGALFVGTSLQSSLLSLCLLLCVITLGMNVEMREKYEMEFFQG